MMFGVIAVIEKEPVINFAVTAHAPGNGLIRVGAVMAEVTIQVAKAMAEVKERQKKQIELQVNKRNRPARYTDTHCNKNRCEQGQSNRCPRKLPFTSVD